MNAWPPAPIAVVLVGSGHCFGFAAMVEAKL
jgi:hypothetical protein